MTPTWIRRRALLGPEDREAILAGTTAMFDRPVTGTTRELWHAEALRSVARDGKHPLSQPGGFGLMVPVELDAWPLVASRVREWLVRCAVELNVDVDTAVRGDGREYEAVVIRYPPGAWLEEHIDTAMSRSPPRTIKLSATVNLEGPQTVEWGHLPPCLVAPGDAVAFPAWRRHYVPPSTERRTSLVLALFGPLWR